MKIAGAADGEICCLENEEGMSELLLKILGIKLLLLGQFQRSWRKGFEGLVDQTREIGKNPDARAFFLPSSIY